MSEQALANNNTVSTSPLDNLIHMDDVANLLKDLSYDPKKVSYSYIVMVVLKKVGLDQTEQAIKTIAKKMDIENKVLSNLDVLENFMSKLSEGALSEGGKTGGFDFDNWLKEGNNATLFKSFKEAWRNLFGTNDINTKDLAAGKIKLPTADDIQPTPTSLLGKWASILQQQDPPIDPSTYPEYTQTVDFLKSFFDSTSLPGSDKTAPSLFQLLFSGHGTEKDYDNIFNNVANDWYKYNQPGQKGNTGYLGNFNSESAKISQLVGGLSTIDSNDLSTKNTQEGQYINIGQQCTQGYFDGVKVFVNNQKSY